MNHQEFRDEETGLVTWVEEDTSMPHGKPRYTVIRAGYLADGLLDPNREPFTENCGTYVDGIKAFELALELVGMDKSNARDELNIANAKVREDLELPPDYVPRGLRNKGNPSNDKAG